MIKAGSFARMIARLPSVYKFSSEKTNWNNLTAEEEKANAAVAKNIGLSRYLTRTYNTTALGLMGSLSVSYLGYTLPIFALNPTATMIGGAVAMLGGFISAQYMKTKHIT